MKKIPKNLPKETTKKETQNRPPDRGRKKTSTMREFEETNETEKKRTGKGSKKRIHLPRENKKKKKKYVEVGTYVVGVMDEGCDGWTFCDGWMDVLRMIHGLE